MGYAVVDDDGAHAATFNHTIRMLGQMFKAPFPPRRRGIQAQAGAHHGRGAVAGDALQLGTGLPWKGR